MHDLIRIQNVYVELTHAEIHDMPQVHRAVLVLGNTQQPRRTIIAAGRGIKHLIRQLANEDKRLDAARQALRWYLAQHRTVNHPARQHL